MTLTELAIVGVLAALVVMGLITFYMSSQATWMAGSEQALAQRDATLLIETLTDSVRAYSHAVVFESPDPLHQGVVIYDEGGTERVRFWWNAGDSLVHMGPGLGQDRGPVVASRITRFQLDTLERIVELRLLELHGSDGQLVRMASAAALYNRVAP